MRYVLIFILSMIFINLAFGLTKQVVNLIQIKDTSEAKK